MAIAEPQLIQSLLTNERYDRAPIIQLRNVVKAYKTASTEFEALRGINLDIYAGEYVGIIGKSGAGKTTLINMISGVDHLTSGEVIVNGTAVHNLNETQMAFWRGLNLGVVFQFFQLLPMLSLIDNIMLPMDFCGLYRPRESYERAMDLLRMVELEEHAHKLPSAISGGQQQRVAIARALANDPPIILGDEPTGSLDSGTADTIFQIFEELVHRGKTVVIVTHDSSMAQRVTRTVLIADGEVINDYVAQALPQLTYQQMLHATHNLEAKQFTPGSVIIQEGEPCEYFYIVAAGKVEVALKRSNGADIVVARYGPGQFFGEIEMLQGGQSIASVRASVDAPVEVLALERETFKALIDESETAYEAVQHVVKARLAENLSTRNKNKLPKI